MKLSHLNSDDSPIDDDEESLVLAEIKHWHITRVISAASDHEFRLCWDDRQPRRMIIAAAYRWYRQRLLSYDEFCQYAQIISLEHREYQHDR